MNMYVNVILSVCSKLCVDKEFTSTLSLDSQEREYPLFPRPPPPPPPPPVCVLLAKILSSFPSYYTVTHICGAYPLVPFVEADIVNKVPCLFY